MGLGQLVKGSCDQMRHDHQGNEKKGEVHLHVGFQMEAKDAADEYHGDLADDHREFPPPNFVSEPRVEQTPPKLHLLVPETLPTAIQENGRRQRQTHRVDQDLRQGHEQHHRQMRAHKTGLLQIGGQPQSVANPLALKCRHALLDQRRVGQVQQDDDGEHDDLFASGPTSDDDSEEAGDDLFADDDEADDLFADEGEDDLFADDGDEDELFADEPAETSPVEEAAEPVDEYAAVEDEPEVADDGDDDDIDALFA